MDKQKVKTGVVLVFPQKRIFFYTLPVGKFAPAIPLFCCGKAYFHCTAETNNTAEDLQDN